MCSIHQLHLVTGHCLTLVGSRGENVLGFVSALYSMSLLLRTPGYYLRMLERLDAVVRFFLLRKTGPPPPTARAEAIGVLKSLGLQVDAEGCQELLRLFNGHWHTPSLVHHCAGTGCCRNVEHTVERMVSVLHSTVFSRLPPVPMSSRWTRVTECLLYFMLGFALHGVYIKVHRAAFDPSGGSGARQQLVSRRGSWSPAMPPTARTRAMPRPRLKTRQPAGSARWGHG